MLNRIIEFSINNKFKVSLLVLALIVFGVYSLTKLPIDAQPDITNNQVQIITVSPALGANDIERFVSVPIELATRNIPGIIEQRSFSRFGLNIVTIVFDDNTDVYWARQQVSEKLTEVKEQIPAGMGMPSLAPVTTGLGEIYQYIIKPKKGYEDKYSLTDLRTIQDWVIRKQLIGTEGVAEVSSFGGNLKQYEVQVDPARLKSMNVTVAEVYDAVAKNNQNAGGAYIEKGPTALFIRTEGLVNNTADIENTVVKQLPDAMPVLVRDVAIVRIGKAVRYGAMTYNEEGEVAGAVVMMLKGANSNAVIRNIKERIKKIEKTLPEGVEIVAFLDRTKMVNNAIDTVKTNLLEGALIVIFVLVLFLGNLRAGFVVASVIPLSMLFAFIMMNLFGVSGNLMSLGALDFGLLVDGAVIIVEAVMHRLKLSAIPGQRTIISQQEMNLKVEASSKKMMNSAVFGQIIILIVYLPILALQGIEGKMFKPMAQTVSFALIGAFILSVTYVPMMTSLLLSRKISGKDNFADKMIALLYKWYKPVLTWTLKIPKLIVAVSIVVFAASIYLLTTLGGEFIPQLEEGDFAVSAVALTGSSLDNTTAMVQKASGVLKRKFPEVNMVVGKVGSSEVPTDPMAMEAADLMVILKDKKEWTSAKTFPELAEKMSEELKNVPGLSVGFQFPVQMRFNELMTGSRQDVVCKIFGENLDTLSAYADRIGKLIRTIHGAKDLYVETVSGVQQVVIRYNRQALANYGVTIEDVNKSVSTAYAGSVAGVVFEEDKRFDLVLKMDNSLRKDAANISNLQINTAGGMQIPLNLVADISVEDGPYQIQREDAQRRITVGFNVRGRDVESVVKELQDKSTDKIKLPVGYSITFGGQYENLNHASQRLAIALPVALALIFLMLFFAFKKIKYCLLIFTAIPLSTVGGILALWIRGMPFSISAGVGFIALFGVAVLNGIVLVSEVNRLKNSYNDFTESNILKAIYEGTEKRMRPVLMTAFVASLGFLPMALSTGAGGEVQRPLATVVIGGLITSTMLTLFELPALYLLMERLRKNKINTRPVVGVFVILLCTVFGFSHANAQALQRISLDQALSAASNQSLQLGPTQKNILYREAMLNTARIIDPMTVSAEAGNVNSPAFDTKFSVSQSLSLPIIYKRENTLLEKQLQAARIQLTLDKALLAKEVKSTYVQVQYLNAKKQLMQRINNIVADYRKVAQLRYEKGETNLLEKTSLESQMASLQMQLAQLDIDLHTYRKNLGILMHTDGLFEPTDSLNINNHYFSEETILQHPYLQVVAYEKEIAKGQADVERSKLLPGIFFGYNNQSITGWYETKDKTSTYNDASKRFHSVEAGLHIPIFTKAQRAKIRAMELMQDVADANLELAKMQLLKEWTLRYNDLERSKSELEYYRSTGLPHAETIIRTANANYRNGEINYIEWSTLFHSAISILNDYVDAMKRYNDALTGLEYLSTK